MNMLDCINGIDDFFLSMFNAKLNKSIKIKMLVKRAIKKGNIKKNVIICLLFIMHYLLVFR